MTLWHNDYWHLYFVDNEAEEWKVQALRPWNIVGFQSGPHRFAISCCTQPRLCSASGLFQSVYLTHNLLKESRTSSFIHRAFVDTHMPDSVLEILVDQERGCIVRKMGIFLTFAVNTWTVKQVMLKRAQMSFSCHLERKHQMSNLCTLYHVPSVLTVHFKMH